MQWKGWFMQLYISVTNTLITATTTFYEFHKMFLCPVHIWLLITVESEEICTHQEGWCLQSHGDRKHTTSAP